MNGREGPNGTICCYIYFAEVHVQFSPHVWAEDYVCPVLKIVAFVLSLLWVYDGIYVVITEIIPLPISLEKLVNGLSRSAWSIGIGGIVARVERDRILIVNS